MNRLIWRGDRVYRKIADRAPSITGEIAEILADKARQNAPEKSGDLKRSIHADGNSVIADAEHASVVELGTATRAAKPYMRPAIEQFNQVDLRQAIK